MADRLASRADYERALAGGASLVIVDAPTTSAQFHLRPARCKFVPVDQLRLREERDGSWWAVADEPDARARWGSMLTLCGFCTGSGHASLAPAHGAPAGGSPGWSVGLGRVAWSAVVPAAPEALKSAEFFARAVPGLDGRSADAIALPCVAVVRVTASGRDGPEGLAKPLLDALHDARHYGPYHHAFGRRPPLAGDGPGSVSGLAVQVRTGEPESTEYLLGGDLTVAGEMLAAIDVDDGGEVAPADVRPRGARLEADRRRFAAAVVRGWQACERPEGVAAATLVVRHRPIPGREEDSTWRTWLGALRGTTGGGAWTVRSPLAGIAPSAIATLADPTLDCDVRYELYRRA